MYRSTTRSWSSSSPTGNHRPTASPDGFESALEKAREAVRGKDVRVGGGVATIRQGLRAGLIDELHIAVSPVLLGRGERLFDGVDLVSLGYESAEHVGTPNATHVIIRKKAG
jgi:dihydrofolate reductase